MAITKSADDAELKKALATGAKRIQTDNSQVPPIACYCAASVIMTVINKFVVSGANFSMNFLLLCIQSMVCIGCVVLVKKAGIISFRDFDMQDAKAWFPVSFMLVTVIYTGSKSLQFLSIPVFGSRLPCYFLPVLTLLNRYTIFKNLTIILIAYGEVFWFGGRVTGLTFISFIFMVISSVIAAWSDVSGALGDSMPTGSTGASAASLHLVKGVVQSLNVGYFWMLVNCLTSAAYVLSMRKRIKVTGFSDWDSMFYNNLLSIPVLAVFSLHRGGLGLRKSRAPPQTRHVLLSAIAFSGAAAVGISFTTAWCIRATSSTTYSMVGALNKLPVAASGMLFFGDPVTAGSVSAIGVGFFAGLLYAVAKNNQKKAEMRAQGDAIIPLVNRN
ncbi:UDP-galactose transporter [Mycena venus]|uniref:GDP-mannose transporter n=1 Tax=Mycena venus TaxID=2733690 RepID=A0A8H6YE22_9AGAR|nr:UDP-galactose transporter [Mycena venus]